MNDYLLSGENFIETKNANFLLHLDENELRRFGVFGVDAEMRLLGLGEGKESIGGKLYLTNFRLFFQSHSVNRFKGTFSIFLPTIIEAKDVSQPLTLGKVMQIVTQNHNFEFVVWKIPKLITDVTAARDSISPAQIEELRIAVRNAPEKCGDGLKIFPSDLFVRF
jgi:hypothetical protein